MGGMTVEEITSSKMGAKNLLKVLARRNAKENVDPDEAIKSIKKMSQREAEDSAIELIQAFMGRGGDHKPTLGAWWFGIDDDYEGGRRRRRKRGGTVGYGERCGTNEDCDEGLKCELQRLLAGPQVDNNQRGVCKGGRRRRRKRTRRKKKSKRRRRKKTRTKKKRRRRRRK